jgi:hypothetical protein
MRTVSLLVAAGLAGAKLVYAIPNAQPNPTMDLKPLYDAVFGYSPQITAAPSLELMRRRGLDRRELTSGELIGYFAPDSMCGYISGSLGATIACGTASKCAAIAPINGAPGAVGCCPSAGSGCFWVCLPLGYRSIF